MLTWRPVQNGAIDAKEIYWPAKRRKPTDLLIDGDLFASCSQVLFFGEGTDVACQGIVPGHNKGTGAAMSVSGSTVEWDTTLLTRVMWAIGAWIFTTNLW
jgi:hypothetical protein